MTVTFVGSAFWMLACMVVAVKSALDYVLGNNGIFIVYNDASYDNLQEILTPALTNLNSTTIGFEKFNFPSKSFPMTSWFAGQ